MMRSFFSFLFIVLLEFRKTCSHIKEDSTVTIGSINYGDSLIANHESSHTGEIDEKFTMLSSVHCVPPSISSAYSLCMCIHYSEVFLVWKGDKHWL